MRQPLIHNRQNLSTPHVDPTTQTTRLCIIIRIKSHQFLINPAKPDKFLQVPNCQIMFQKLRRKTPLLLRFICTSRYDTSCRVLTDIRCINYFGLLNLTASATRNLIIRLVMRMRSCFTSPMDLLPRKLSKITTKELNHQTVFCFEKA